PAAAKVLGPRMLLLPLVENTIRGGMGDGDSALVICIEAVVEAGVLELKVIDNGGGLRDPKLIENVGLRNTLERLERLYGTAQEMRIEATSGEGFCVVMRLPARAAEEPPREQLRREIA